jgi:hypothetical protein
MDIFKATPEEMKLVYDFLGESPENHLNDWNFLMPLARKILMDSCIDIALYNGQDGWYAYYSLEAMLGMVEIQNCFRDCVQYIKWYNSI